MKARPFALLAGSSVALLTGGPASGEFLGVSTESEVNDGILTVSVFADFDNPGMDFMSAVAGTQESPLLIRVIGGTFYQHPMGTDRPPNPALFSIYPLLRYDSYVTVGVLSYNPNTPGIPEGQPADYLVLAPDDPGPSWPGFGVSELAFENAAWAVFPTEPQRDPFDPVYCYPGDGRVLIGRFSTADGVGITGSMLLQVYSDGEIILTTAHFGLTALELVYVDDDNCQGGTGTEADPFCSIQVAIDLAATDAEIVVAPGIYYEAIDLGGKAVHLYSTGGPQATIIDATGLGQSVVRCVSGEGPGTVIDGFTMTGGQAVDGGGMFNYGSSPTVRDCIFADNFAINDGGGMHNGNGSNPTVSACVFVGNIADDLGGGMSNMSGSPTVTGCTFAANSAVIGGGMGNFNNAPLLVNCTFSGNDGAVGGAIANFDSAPALANCTVVNNDAFNAGGMYNVNSAPIVANSILWGDAPDEFGDGEVAVSYSTVQGGWPGTGNTGADPELVDAANGDLRLSPGSPCIDAGDDAAVPTNVVEDVDGNPRFEDAVIYADSGNGVVDMGAYEADRLTPPPPGPDLAVTFAGFGTWIYDDEAGSYTQIHGTEPAVLAAGDFDDDGNDELAMTFAGFGTWLYDGDTGSFTHIHSVGAASLSAGDFDSDGSDELAMVFPAFGTWIYDDDDMTYTQIHGADASLLAAGDFDNDGADELALAFAGLGTWIYDDVTAAYAFVHDAVAVLFAAGDFDDDASDELAMTLPGLGTWIHDHATRVHRRIHPMEAVLITPGDLDHDGRDELAMTFAAAGTWIYDDDAVTYRLIHGAEAGLLAAGDFDNDGREQLTVTFAGFGTWNYDDLSGAYTQIHGVEAAMMAAGD